MENTGAKQTRKPGSIAVKVGVVLLFVGSLIVLMTIDNPSAASGFAALLGVAGLITLIAGFSQRREHKIANRP